MAPLWVVEVGWARAGHWAGRGKLLRVRFARGWCACAVGAMLQTQLVILLLCSATLHQVVLEAHS